MGASDILGNKQESFASSRKADKCAFSKVSFDDCLAKQKSDSSPVVCSSDFVHDVSPKQSPTELLCPVSRNSVESKQNSCLRNNITSIVTIILAIFIKLLLLLDIVVSRIFIAVNEKSTSFQNKRARLRSDAGSSDFPLKDKLPVCFYEFLKNEDPEAFQVTAAEKEVEIDTVDILDLKDVFVSETVLNNIVLKKKIDPDTSFQTSTAKKNIGKSSVQVQSNSSVSSDVGTVSVHTKSTEDNAISDVATDTIDTISFPFLADGSTVPIGIEGFEFRCLVDTGAAVTAVSANVWNKFLRHVCPTLDNSELENITSVNGGILNTLGKTLIQFVIQSEVFPFEAYVIRNLTYDVILGRDFLWL